MVTDRMIFIDLIDGPGWVTMCDREDTAVEHAKLQAHLTTGIVYVVPLTDGDGSGFGVISSSVAPINLIHRYQHRLIVEPSGNVIRIESGAISAGEHPDAARSEHRDLARRPGEVSHYLVRLGFTTSGRVTLADVRAWMAAVETLPRWVQYHGLGEPSDEGVYDLTLSMRSSVPAMALHGVQRLVTDTLTPRSVTFVNATVTRVTGS